MHVSCHGVLTKQFIFTTILARIWNIFWVPQTTQQNQKRDLKMTFSFLLSYLILLIMRSWTGQSSCVWGKKNCKTYLKINLSLKMSWRQVCELLSPGYGLLSWYKLVTFIFFISLLFSACYMFKFPKGNVFICINFSILASVEGLCCKPKFRANTLYHSLL